MRIALLEDDPDQVALFGGWLKTAGHTCEQFDNGKSFVRNIKHDSYDALILDWMVPDMDGFQVLRWVRENFDWPIPVVFVTARDLEDDIVRALEEGADDYIVKPAKQREFIARLNAVIRRVTPVDEGQTVIEHEPFLIDLANHQIQRNGERVEVTQKEYELIVFLFRNLGRVLSRAHILESVWGRNPDINTRTVDTHVSRIRSKLSLAPDTGWKLSSIYQHGYRLEKLTTV
ncbi:MAG: response regulator transcription factor [Gammaproteobacteria bacterium]